MTKPSSDPFEKVDYRAPRLGMIRWVILFFICFLAAFLLYFKINLASFDLNKQIAENLPCPVVLSETITKLMPPGVYFENIKLSERCAPQLGAINLESTRLSLLGPSFSPLGLYFRVSTNWLGESLEVSTGVGVNTQKFKLDNQTFSVGKLPASLLPVNVSGKLLFSGQLTLKNQQLDDLDLNISSKDILLPSQSIQGLDLPALSIGQLSGQFFLKDPKNLIVKKLIVGDDQSPIRASFQGSIKLNQAMITMSQIDLVGEVKFSDDLLEKFGIIKLIMGQFDNKDGFYQIKLLGSLGAPIPSKP